MSGVKTVEVLGVVTVSAKGPLVHLCPHVDEVDRGSIEIAWRTTGPTLELHSLRHYLDTFREERISHEDITDRIHTHLSATQGIEVVSVTTHWVTAGMEVTCSTSPTPVEKP